MTRFEDRDDRQPALRRAPILRSAERMVESAMQKPCPHCGDRTEASPELLSREQACRLHEADLECRSRSLWERERRQVAQEEQLDWLQARAQQRLDLGTLFIVLSVILAGISLANLGDLIPR